MMTPKAKQAKTRHRDSAAKAANKKLIEELRDNWRTWDHVKLGERLSYLVEKQHCSARGLASDLGVAPTTIRRYICLAGLPEEEREKLKATESEKKALARKSARDRQRESQDRLAEEKKQGSQSDAVESIIFDFCRTAGRGPEGEISQISAIIVEARQIVRGQSTARPEVFKLQRELNLNALYKKTKPLPYPDEFEFEHRAGWLANLLMVIAPEEVIRDRAMAKAEEHSYSNWSAPGPQEVDKKWAKLVKCLLPGRSRPPIQGG